MGSFEIRVPRIVKDWYTTVIGATLGTLAAGWAFCIYLNILDFEKHAITTEATVVKVEYETHRYKMLHERTTYFPVVRFSDAQGNLRQAHCRLPRKIHKKLHIGDTLSIVYRPEDTNEVKIDNKSVKYGCFFWMIAGTTMAVWSIQRIRTRLKRQAPYVLK